MLTKLIKYDWNFSRKTYFYLLCYNFVLTAILLLLYLGFKEYNEFFLLIYTISAYAGSVFVIIDSVRYYGNNLFYKTGHLMLSLPVKPLDLILSKNIITLCWVFLYILISFSGFAVLMHFTGNNDQLISLIGSISNIAYTPVNPIIILIIFFSLASVLFNVLKYFNIFFLVSTCQNIFFNNSAVLGFVSKIVAVVYIIFIQNIIFLIANLVIYILGTNLPPDIEILAKVLFLLIVSLAENALFITFNVYLLKNNVNIK